METFFDEQLALLESVSRLWYSDTSCCKINGLYFGVKRGVDVLGATLAILLLLPFMLLIAILIKCTSRGPVLFAQKRVGYRGQEFTFLKFRTMVHNCDDSIHKDYVTRLIKGQIKGENTSSQKPLYKLARDDRVTRIGKFLRKWSLDELPQFFNVLKGEMSLVGPRPPIPYEVKNYSAWHLQRLDVLPGITGLWQVKGRSRTTFEEMVRLDLYYIRNWSIWLDLKILLLTIPAVLRRDGAL